MVNINKDLELVNVFRDVDLHAHIAHLIVKHSSNHQDIRQLAISSLDLRSCQKILDLGCAFGFFSQALKGTVHPKAKIIGIDAWADYQDQFISSNNKAELESEFHAADINVLEKIPHSNFDLIICSYALYFFPDTIPHIARLLNRNGIFITLTHVSPHMIQLIDLIKTCLQSFGIDSSSGLPEEKLINRFSSKNGRQLLTPWFGNVKEIEYKNSLTFSPSQSEDLIKYVQFKQLYFIPEYANTDAKILPLLEECVSKRLCAEKEFIISKDDIIYICTNPRISGS
jgi:ubiquinone/menaquinone biosynthesis C-methylase UbiE